MRQNHLTLSHLQEQYKARLAARREYAQQIADAEKKRFMQVQRDAAAARKQHDQWAYENDVVKADAVKFQRPCCVRGTRYGEDERRSRVKDKKSAELSKEYWKSHARLQAERTSHNPTIPAGQVQQVARELLIPTVEYMNSQNHYLSRDAQTVRHMEYETTGDIFMQEFEGPRPLNDQSQPSGSQEFHEGARWQQSETLLFSNESNARQRICLLCMSTFDASDGCTLPCKHAYCGPCIKGMPVPSAFIVHCVSYPPFSFWS